MGIVLLVIPTYNESENIQRLFLEIQEILTEKRVDWHILVVDDSSSDGTAEVVREISLKFERMHLLLRPGKLGLGSAYIDGFRWGINHLNPSIFIQMDADLSHPPKVLHDLLKPLVDDAVISLASRYVNGGGSVLWSIRRQIVSRVANTLSRMLLGINVRDVTTGFRALRREVVDEILHYQLDSKGYSYQVESLLLFERLDLKVYEVPFVFEERATGGSKLSMAEIIRFLWVILKLSFRGDPKKWKTASR